MTRRYRHGLATYKPRTAATIAAAAKRRAARKPAHKPRSRALPAPKTAAAHRLHLAALGPVAGYSAEARALKADALADALGRKGYEGSAELWREYLDANYRKLYNAQQKGRRAARPKHPSAWIKVRAYRRRRPGRKS